jgi:hypothetical protein
MKIWDRRGTVLYGIRAQVVADADSTPFYLEAELKSQRIKIKWKGERFYNENHKHGLTRLG